MTDLVKIVVTVPQAEADALRQVIGKAGGGQIGNYSYCSYSVLGTGRFLPIDGATPTIGHIGNPEQVIEERIEITCERDRALKVVEAVRRSHSYEEPAIDVYPLISL